VPSMKKLKLSKIRAAAGRRGGKSRSKAKVLAVKQNIIRARLVRWKAVAK